MVFDSTIQIQHVPSRREMPDYLDSLGFKADYVPCVNKVAIDWKVNVENGQIDTHFMPSGASYAVVPSYGMLVLDCDRAKDGAESGMAIVGGLLRQAFSNDEDFFAARTFRVHTPSGGVHLYYRIPEWMRGHIKSASHVHGIPIDVKCERKGYVVGPYSVTDKGEYLPYVSMVDPESGMNWMPAQIPEMPEPICAFLIVNGYTDLTAQLPRPSSAWGTGIQLCGGGFSSDKNVDLSAIPEGSRNDELYRWCFGRFVNHPENRDQIIRDAFIRGNSSGLSETEITTIVGSALHGSQEVAR
jgi:hypothetical protein